MRIMFYAPQHTGHHYAYLARMLPGFLELPIEPVVVTTPEGLASDEFKKLLSPLANSLEILTYCTPPPQAPVANAKHRLRELSAAIRQVQPDHVAVCYADGIWEQAYLKSLLGRRPWPNKLVVEGWIYRGRFGDTRDNRFKSRVRRGIFSRLLRKELFHKLHLDHELLYEFASRRAVAAPTEVVLTPNPIVIKEPISKEDARRELGLALNGKLLCLSGMIARFKGADLLLKAYQHRRENKSDPSERLLLAGPHEESIRSMLGQAPFKQWIEEGQIISLDRYLNENEMFTTAATADLVLAPYPHHQGRSSIILWAAAAGRPCLGTDQDCIGYVIRKQRLGMTCPVHDPVALSESISAALTMPWTKADAQRVRQYAEFHSVENYQQVASQLVRDLYEKNVSNLQPQ